MKIKKLIIKNYKIFKELTIEMNNEMNIFIGENNTGKTTLLDAIQLVMTQKLNGVPIMQQLTCDWFNKEIRDEYVHQISNHQDAPLPVILIEVYFLDEKDNVQLNKFRGTNNSSKSDEIGIQLKIEFDQETYSDNYEEMLKQNQITDIPIDFYKVEFVNFAGSKFSPLLMSEKIGIINTTKKDYYFNSNKLITENSNNLLNNNKNHNIATQYKNVRRQFNEKYPNIVTSGSFKDLDFLKNKEIRLNLKEENIDEWKNEFELMIDGIPYRYNGTGTQNMIKSELFVNNNKDIDILLVEEPENNLAYTNMCILVNRLFSNNPKQIFISTHSSYIANKLGLRNLLLLNHNEIKKFSQLDEKVNKFFMKLPNNNVLRIILSNHIILVEGPSDELIIQKAYHDIYGRFPIDDGIDIMCVNGITFENYCWLAQLIHKKIIVITDNDGKLTIKQNKFDKFDCVTLCIENNNNLKTLEPSIYDANKNTLDEFKLIIKCGNKYETQEEIIKYMSDNKTEWSLNVYLSDKKINYPKYILDAIDNVRNEIQ